MEESKGSKRESSIGDLGQSQEAPADKARLRRGTCSTSPRACKVSGITASDALAVEVCPRTPMKVFRQQMPSSDWSGDVTATPTSYTTSTPYPCTPTTEVMYRTIGGRLKIYDAMSQLWYLPKMSIEQSAVLSFVIKPRFRFFLGRHLEGEPRS